MSTTLHIDIFCFGPNAMNYSAHRTAVSRQLDNNDDWKYVCLVNDGIPRQQCSLDDGILTGVTVPGTRSLLGALLIHRPGERIAIRHSNGLFIPSVNSPISSELLPLIYQHGVSLL